MTGPFVDTQQGLIAPVSLFDARWPAPPNGKGVAVPHSMRASLAMELAHQLGRRLPNLVIKGGTPLQARLGWPPARASVDVDAEHSDIEAVLRACRDVAAQFAPSRVVMDEPVQQMHATGIEFHFPLADAATDVAIRLDVARPGSSTQLAVPWTNAPQPWTGSAPLRVPPLEVHAAQKLLLAADSPFGRHVNDPGRDTSRVKENLCKDLFDLTCLARQPLDSAGIARAVKVEVTTKAALQGQAYTVEQVIASAQAGWSRFADARVDASEEHKSFWRAFTAVHRGILAPYTEADARIAAGCTHHALWALKAGKLDWRDAWRPLTEREARRAMAEPLTPVMVVKDGFQAARGLPEAWAAPPGI